MPAYVCVTHALARREETDSFCRGLSRYGFRFSCIHEMTEPQHREETLTEASLLIALTNPAAEAAETVASDIRRALARKLPVLCVSMEENGLDSRFCSSAEGDAVLIPAPSATSPDRNAVALFIHRLFVRHLAGQEACFSAVRCVEDTFGRTIAAAVAAHKGDPQACYALGMAYERGEGVPKLEVEAAHWLRLAADKGILNARIRMGELYLTGRGTERDPAAAFRLFTEAAAAGAPQGDYHRGKCYLEGLGVMKDPERALDCFKLAAEDGYAPALYELGLLYRDGVGTPKDYRAAARALYLACQFGSASAEGEGGFSLSLLGHPTGEQITCVTMRQLRRSRLKAALRRKLTAGGRSVSESRLDSLAAVSFGKSRVTHTDLPEDGWIREMTEAIRNGKNQPSADASAGFSVAHAAVTLGRLMAEGDPATGIPPHPTRALVWYRYALYLGSAEAICCLGDAYRRGYGLPADAERAFRLFALSAEMGDEGGQFALGVCCEQGIGTSVDLHRAFLSYERAAKNGYPPAQNNLGGCYEHGLGVVRDMTAAVEWYARAATELPEAACRLGLCYEEGRGVEVDPAKAVRLYETAVEGGHPYAMYRLALCYDRGLRGKAVILNAAPAEEPVHPAHALDTDVIPAEQAPDYSYAARLLERAAEGGVADAAYVLSLYYGKGRGVRRDEERRLAWLTEAAEGGCLPACYELGMCYLEGRTLVRNRDRAVACFADAATLWAESGDHVRRETRPEGILAESGLTLAEAAGAALYMLGYCALYAIGDRGNPAIEGNLTPAERVTLAAAYFRDAAAADHVGSLTALGDLYAYGLLKPETATAEDESLRYYMEAARVGTSRAYISEMATDSPIDALLSLANCSRQVAEAAAAEGDEGSAELAKVQTWRSLAGGAEEGSLDAYVSMAACAYRGYGTPKDPTTALWFLNKVARAEKGRVTASLWLGDLYYAGVDREPSPEQAEEAYLRAIETPDTESECGEYTLRERRESRRLADRRARAEACYRLAVLRAVHFADGESRRESFTYLVRAILMGHTAAREDLARMYAYESAYVEATSPKEKMSRRKGLPTPASAYARGRLNRRAPDSDTKRDHPAARSHSGWMTDYYTALWPTPTLFSFGMIPTSAPADRPVYVSAEVTPAMLAAALNYLGDCLFFGEGLPADPAAAAECYREVVSMKIQVPRGQNPPQGQIWARYSYGWCLLHGVGAPRNPREAIRHLTSAAKTHAEACFVLGECYEQGVGVDVADGVEAFKYYSKALKLGYPKAEAKVRELEKKLRAEAKGDSRERRIDAV